MNANKPTTVAYRVPYADTDRLRNELLRERGTAYKEWEARGILLPVIEAYCRYRAPAHYDDLLNISGRISMGKGTRIRIDYEVHRDDTILADGYTVHACLKRSGRPTRIPEELKI